MLRPDMRLERHQRHASSALNHHRASVPPEPWRVRMCVCEEVRLALVVLRACGRRELAQTRANAALPGAASPP